MLSSDFFQVGGSLERGHPSYIERPADKQLIHELERGNLCLVLAPRQTGKSSLMVHALSTLEDVGIGWAIVDLQALGHHRNLDGWFGDVVYQMARWLKLSTDTLQWWQDNKRIGPTQRFMTFIEDVILTETKAKVVIFFDEIDSVLSLPFSDDFFTTLRALFNARASNSTLKRVSFVLLGVASPSEFIRNRSRTPFNIGKEIALTDFSIEEVAPFKAILGPDSIPLIERIFYWTNGQPLMVQALTAKLCALSEEKRTVERLDTMVAATYLNTRIEKEMHLNFIRDYLLDKYHNPRKMLKTYQAVLNDGPVAHDKSALIHSRLLLSGVVRLENGYLKVRNRIYQRVFNRQWITENLPIDRVRIVAYLSSTTLLMVLLWFYLIQPLWFPKFITTQIYPWLQDDIYYVTQPEYHFSMQMPLDQPRRITINGEPYSSREPFDKSKGGEISFDFSKLQVGPNQFKVRFYGTLWQENFETDFVIVFFPSSHWKIPTGLEMVAVPAGCFDMGCGAWTNNCDEDEKPLHRVCLSAFKMGKFELTQAQWQALMGYNPSSFRDVPRLPVENISWQDTQEFLRRLNKITGLSYNLPTEAQWEYAARSAGRPEKYAGGDELNKLGWYGGNSNGRTHPVGSKDANGLGLYDMSGNVWEWCRDWYADDYYSNSPENNPTGPTTGSYRVFRGGPWSLSAGFCRAASRNRGGPGFRIIFLGFRLALFPGRQEASRQVGSAGRSRMEGRAVAGPESAVPVLPIQNESPVNINKRPEEK